MVAIASPTSSLPIRFALKRGLLPTWSNFPRAQQIGKAARDDVPRWLAMRFSGAKEEEAKIDGQVDALKKEMEKMNLRINAARKRQRPAKKDSQEKDLQLQALDNQGLKLKEKLESTTQRIKGSIGKGQYEMDVDVAGRSDGDIGNDFDNDGRGSMQRVESRQFDISSGN